MNVKSRSSPCLGVDIDAKEKWNHVHNEWPKRRLTRHSLRVLNEVLDVHQHCTSSDIPCEFGS